MAKAKPIQGIDCHTSAAEAIGPVLITRLKEMCSHRGRALDWSDPEGVHDMRVSSRRLRGALSDFAPYLSKRRLTDVLKQIKSVADALGDVRDQDVAIMGLKKLSTNAPEQAAITLDQFIQSRETIRKKARKDLRHSLRISSLKRIQGDFAQAMDSAIKKSDRQKGHSKTEVLYVEIARSIINKRLKEVEKLSDGFYHPLKVKPLHKMRIASKRLRYALELFEPCLGPDAASFAKRVARLQTSLGELHDCDIWINTFGEQLEQAKHEAVKDRVAGSLWLLSHFVRLHSKHLRNALAKWEEWESHEFSRELRGLLNNNKSDSEAETPTITVEVHTVTSSGSSVSSAKSR